LRENLTTETRGAEKSRMADNKKWG